MTANVKFILSDAELQNVQYKDAQVIKVYEDDVYDIKFPAGNVRTFIENTSSLTYNSGDYVAVLISISGSSNVCKIIGRGKKIGQVENIPVVRV
jgi:hypothetical protein